MKVILINGSPREKGCTFTALLEIANTLNKQNIETEILQIGNQPIQDCIGCNQCLKKGNCYFLDDCIHDWLEKVKSADGFIFGTPVYFAHPSGRILSALDRLFYAGLKYFEHKPAAVIACARRGGTTATLDTISKYLGIAQMPIISSTYWNMVHGNTPKEIKQDLEGMQTMRNVAYNMAWILKCIEVGEQSGIIVPQNEVSQRTNFIR